MFRKYERDLQWLQEELIAAEQDDEEYEDEYDDEYDDEYEYDEDLDPEEDIEEDEDVEEEDPEEVMSPVGRRYGRGSPRRFEDRDFFEDDVDDSEVLLKKDYKKAKRKKARKNAGLVLLAMLELLGIAAVLLWWASWGR